MEDSVLILSDSSSVEEHESLVFAADREEAAERLSAGGFRAVCLDRREVENTLSDARWLRRRRNRLPVLAWVDTPQVARASDLFAAGVEEIIVRDAGAPESMLARLDVIDRRPGRPVLPLAAEGITARSPAMRACLERVEKAQRSEATVLLQGETGTGKDVLARMIHAGGRRAKGPFVAINCSAFPETLLESELFGYERGAFTGAHRSKRGHFEQANGGTLFLDEVGETSLGSQVKLLRVLQEGKVRPLGSNREHKVDARIVAARNRDLLHAVGTVSFRRDLFYRLNVLPISLPPLRARVEDIVPLVQGFLARSGRPHAPKTIAPDAARLLETFAWPGQRERRARGDRAHAVPSDPGHGSGAVAGYRFRDAAREHGAFRGLGLALRTREARGPSHRHRAQPRRHPRVSLQEAPSLRDAISQSSEPALGRVESHPVAAPSSVALCVQAVATISIERSPPSTSTVKLTSLGPTSMRWAASAT